jgi:hypothetical protein
LKVSVLISDSECSRDYFLFFVINFKVFEEKLVKKILGKYKENFEDENRRMKIHFCTF